MAITISHSPSTALIGQLAYESGESTAEERRARILADERLRFLNFLEGQRRYDTDTSLRIDDQDFRQAATRRQLADRAHQFGAGLQQAALDRQLRYGLAQQQNERLENYSEGQLELQREGLAGQQNRDQLRLEAQFARDRLRRVDEQREADRVAIENFRGWRDEGQKEAYIRQWEQKYGRDWNVPIQEVNAEQQRQAMEQRLPSLRSLFTFEDQPLMDDAALQQFVEFDEQTNDFAVNWTDAARAASALQRFKAEERLREKDEQTIEENAADLEAKREKEAADLAAKEESNYRELLRDIINSSNDSIDVMEGDFPVKRLRTPEERQQYVRQMIQDYRDAGLLPPDFHHPALDAESDDAGDQSQETGPSTHQGEKVHPTATTKEEYDTIPSGALYLRSDGEVVRKQ